MPCPRPFDRNPAKTKKACFSSFFIIYRQKNDTPSREIEIFVLISNVYKNKTLDYKSSH